MWAGAEIKCQTNTRLNREDGRKGGSGLRGYRPAEAQERQDRRPVGPIFRSGVAGLEGRALHLWLESAFARPMWRGGLQSL